MDINWDAMMSEGAPAPQQSAPAPAAIDWDAMMSEGQHPASGAVTRPAPKPKPETPKPPKKIDPLADAYHDLMKGVGKTADDAARKTLDYVEAIPGLGGVVRGQEDSSKRQVEELHKTNLPTQIAAGAAGVVHGALKFPQDVYNATVAPLVGGQPVTVADDYKNLAGVRSLAKDLPETFQGGSTGGAMALPLKIPGGVLAKIPGAAKIGAKIASNGVASAAAHAAEGAAGGSVYGYTGSAGDQYKDTGHIDQKEALKAAGDMAAYGGVLSSAAHGAGKVGKIFKSKAKPTEAAGAPWQGPTQNKRAEIPQFALDAAKGEEAPPDAQQAEGAHTEEVKGEVIDHKVRQTPRQVFKSSSPEIKAALEAKDLAEKGQEPGQEIMQAPEQNSSEAQPVAPGNHAPELPAEHQGAAEPTPITEKQFHETNANGLEWRASELTDDQLRIANDLYANEPKSDKFKAVSTELANREAEGRKVINVDGENHTLTGEQSKMHDELVNDHRDIIAALGDDHEAIAKQFDAHDQALRDLVTPHPPETLPHNLPVSRPPAELLQRESSGALGDQQKLGTTPPVPDLREAPPPVPEKEATNEPTPQSAETKPGYTAGPDPNRKGYVAVFNPDGTVHSSSKRSRGTAEKVAQRLNDGTTKPTAGAREISRGSADAKESTQPIFADGSALPEDHVANAKLAAVADAKHAMDEARAERDAAYDQFKADHGLETKYSDKPEFQYDRELEKQTMAAHPDQVGIEVQNSKKYSGEFKFKTGSTPEQQAARVKELTQKVNEAEKAYKEARTNAQRELVKAKDAGEIESGSVNVPHEKGDVNVRFVPNGEAAVKMREKQALPVAQEIARAFKDLKEHIANANRIATDIAMAVVKSDGVTLADPTMGIATTLGRLAKYAKDKGISLKGFDARNVQQVLLNQSTSDKYYLHGSPEFGEDFRNARGALDLAFQGTEHLKTDEQHQAWKDARYDSPKEIRNGRANIPTKYPKSITKNYSQKFLDKLAKTNKLNAERNIKNSEHNERLATLSDAQKEALIKSNAALDNLSDLFEQQIEKLEKDGVSDEGAKGLVGQGNLLATLKNDLKQLDPRRYYGDSWSTALASNVTGGLYRMYVTGNWPIHQLHFLEAGTAGLSYNPIAFVKAVHNLTPKIGNEHVKAYVNSFDASSGLMKQIKDENPTYGPKAALNATEDVINKLGGKVGNDQLGSQIIKNPASNKIGSIWNSGVEKATGAINAAGEKAGVKDLSHKAGEVIEGSAAETQKVHVMRAMALEMAANEMGAIDPATGKPEGYKGGAAKLAEDINNAATDPKAMTPEARLEAAGRIVHHMNEMIGYSPNGYTDSNFFNRAARGDSSFAPLLKLITPFTSTRTVQSRLMTKYTANLINSIGAKDFKGAAASVGSLLAFHGLIALIGGRSAVTKDVQDALHAADAHLAKEFLEGMDNMNILGHAFDKEFDHLTPSYFVAGHIGDGFPSQLASAISDAADKDKNALQRARGVATSLAALGLSSVGDRMGTSTILKFAKALKEGMEGSKTEFMFNDKNTVDSFASQGISAQKLAKTLGAHVEPGKDKSYLGKVKLSTSVLQALYQTAVAGKQISAAEMINHARDDMAFGESIRRMDSKKYDQLYRQFEHVVRNPQQLPAHGEKLPPGFWQQHYEQMQKEHEPKLAATEA